jgi:ElaB/YqjD/DUF883 family membrane-anchored ribosome-binding protein
MIARHPLTALGIAGAVGITLGVLVKRLGVEKSQ